MTSALVQKAKSGRRAASSYDVVSAVQLDLTSDEGRACVRYPIIRAKATWQLRSEVSAFAPLADIPAVTMDVRFCPCRLTIDPNQISKNKNGSISRTFDTSSTSANRLQTNLRNKKPVITHSGTRIAMSTMLRHASDKGCSKCFSPTAATPTRQRRRPYRRSTLNMSASDPKRTFNLNCWQS